MSIQNYSLPEEPPSEQKVPRRCFQGHVLRLMLASLCVCGAIASWVIMAEKLQKLNENYKKPYFLTYWVHSFYALVYVTWKLWSLYPGGLRCNRVGEGALPFSRKLFLSSGFLAFVSMFSAYMWYQSLSKTNIPANTAIFQSASVFVFIISVPLLREKVTLLKVLSVALSVVGVTLVALYSTNAHCSENHLHNSTDTNQTSSAISADMLTSHQGHASCTEKSTVYGYVFLLLSVITYAVFEVSYKKLATAKDDPAAVTNGARVLGYIGVHTLLWLWPPIVIFHFSGLERFELPTRGILLLMFWNGLLDIIFNACLLICIALTSPLFATVGTVLAIPVSVIVDWIVQGFLLPPQAFVGIVLIVGGFASFTFSEFIAARRKARRERAQRDGLVNEDRETALNNSAVSAETCSSTDERSPLLKEGGERRRKLWNYIF